MKNIIVFGGSGFLGSHVADKLSHSGYNVSIFDKVESNFILDNQKMIKGNIVNSEEVDKALEDIDYVFNFAGLADIEESKKDPLGTVEQNILGNLIILNSSRYSLKINLSSGKYFKYSVNKCFCRNEI